MKDWFITGLFSLNQQRAAHLSTGSQGEPHVAKIRGDN